MSHRYYTRVETSRRGRERTSRIIVSVFERCSEWFWFSSIKGTGGPHAEAKHAKLSAGLYLRRRGWTGEGKWS